MGDPTKFAGWPKGDAGEQHGKVDTGVLGSPGTPRGDILSGSVGVMHPLQRILNRAFHFAVYGKGYARHGQSGLPWEYQRHAEIGREVGTGFALGQAVKKTYESRGLGAEAAVRELLGAITYLGSAIFILEEQEHVSSQHINTGQGKAVCQGRTEIQEASE